MGTFSPWFSGTPSYSTYSRDMSGSSLLSHDKQSVKQVQQNQDNPIASTASRQQPTPVPQVQRRQQAQPAQRNYLNDAKTLANIAKTFTKSDVTGTGPSMPGYSAGMDLSGEAAIEAADFANAVKTGTTIGEAIPVTAETLTAPAAAEGALAVGETATLAPAVETGAAVTAGTETAGAAPAAAGAGMSATGIGAAIAAAILAIEGSTGWNSQQVLDKQWNKGLSDIQKGDYGSLVSNWVSNPYNYAVQGGDITASRLTGIDNNLMPATAIGKMFSL